ncbi:hypothetical protein QTP88_010622 [Uroleucon formosanum]
MTSIQVRKNAEVLRNKYKDDLSTLFANECVHFRSHLLSIGDKAPKTIQDMCSFLRKNDLIGIGHTQLSEFSFLEIPSLSCSSYIKIQSTLAKVISDSAWEEMRKAGEEEKELALKCGNVDTDGIPMCTKEIAHQCFLNWKKASTSMEADGVIEGFSKSIELHGLKFNKLIGDGDSSVMKRLQEIQPYGPNFFIEKIECTNHLLRNYASKLNTLAKVTKYPLRVRKFIITNIIRFRSDITKSVKHWIKDSKLTKLQKIKEIQKDLANAPFHRLGQHVNCASYFCQPGEKKKN